MTQSNAQLELREPKPPYQTPQLRPLGDVRMLTLGGSAGRGDSGSPGTQRVMRL
ncbi:MAG: hypothetical protein IT479_06545 [Xanthomonadales bacterium]|nr:hypothetical protein [Xanthomonadales bacterium]MCC6592918.1 hypothetical protein [Xanthomonadales bacterium]